jgi:adenylate kinase
MAEKQEFVDKTNEYLESNEVYDLFDSLLKQLVINQPANPIKFLMEQLKKKPPLMICVLGPPGVNRSRFCGRLAAEYKVKHIQVGKLLKERRELKDEIETGTLVRDDVVIDIVKKEVAKAKGTGWVLDGFPRTKVQAQALQTCGVYLDRVLLLNGSEKMIRQKYAVKMSAAGLDIEAQEEAINRRLQHYFRHIVSVAECFRNVLRQNDGTTGDDDMINESMKKMIQLRPYSNAPLRPPRVAIVGPCGSGRSTQCQMIAKHYGCVHVDIAALVKDVQDKNKSAVAEVPAEFVSDEELCDLVGKRLNEIDCVRKGWVLDGFPKTAGQAEFLRKAHLFPSRVLCLTVDEDVVVQRMSSRRIDPVTGIAYYGPPPTVSIRQRVIQAQYDQADGVRDRYQKFQDNVGEVLRTFAGLQPQPVKGDQTIFKVQEVMQEIIDRPLPKEVAQDPEEEN